MFNFKIISNIKPQNNKTPFKYFIFPLLISLSLMFFNNSRFLYWVKNGINFLLFPSQERLSILLKENKNKFDTFTSILNVYNENIWLKNKLKNYDNLKFKMTRIEQENKELKTILQLDERFEFNAVNCKVIGRTLDEWYSAIIIDKGMNDGIKKGATVVSLDKEQKILVGQIVEVFNNYSKVLMISNLSSNILAFVPSKNAYSIVSGENEKFLNMQPLENCDGLEDGDLVFTSGLGGIFLEGIYIGKIESIERYNGKIQKVLIAPHKEIYGLSFVSVINRKKQY